ncbi:MAG: hypothetical protein WCP92_05250 [bacterium]
MIGSTHGIFMVMISVPALKLGYKVMVFSPLSPSVMTKSFDFTKLNWVLVILFFIIDFVLTVHGINNHCLLTIFTTLFNGLLSFVLIFTTRLGS